MTIRWGKLLCAVGRHRWRLFCTDAFFYGACQQCVRCGDVRLR